MTLPEFYDACANFDWYYEYSDDHRWYISARRRADELHIEARSNPEKQRILDAVHAWKTQGGAAVERPA